MKEALDRKVQKLKDDEAEYEELIEGKKESQLEMYSELMAVL